MASYILDTDADSPSSVNLPLSDNRSPMIVPVQSTASLGSHVNKPNNTQIPIIKIDAPEDDNESSFIANAHLRKKMGISSGSHDLRKNTGVIYSNNDIISFISPHPHPLCSFHRAKSAVPNCSSGVVPYNTGTRSKVNSAPTFRQSRDGLHVSSATSSRFNNVAGSPMRRTLGVSSQHGSLMKSLQHGSPMRSLRVPGSPMRTPGIPSQHGSPMRTPSVPSKHGSPMRTPGVSSRHVSSMRTPGVPSQHGGGGRLHHSTICAAAIHRRSSGTLFNSSPMCVIPVVCDSRSVAGIHRSSGVAVSGSTIHAVPVVCKAASVHHKSSRGATFSGSPITVVPPTPSKPTRNPSQHNTDTVHLKSTDSLKPTDSTDSLKPTDSLKLPTDSQGSDSGMSSDSLSSLDDSDSFSIRRRRLDSLTGLESGNGEDQDVSNDTLIGLCCLLCYRIIKNKRFKYSIDPHGRIYFWWMCLVSLAWIYNALAIPLRASFNVSAGGWLYLWLILDYLLADPIYVADMVLIQTHLSFRSKGVLQSEWKVLAKRYFQRWKVCALDILCLLPLDILYAVPVLRFNALLRLPRLLKFHSFTMFQGMYESWTSHPYAFRIAKMVMYFFYICHIYTCIYYAISKIRGFGTNDWVYSGKGFSYLRCFYWAVRTVSTIHELEENNPTNTLEFTVEMFAYLGGVFVIAVIIGELKSIVEGAHAQSMTTKRRLERLKEYMKLQNLPKELRNRVQLWYDYVLAQQIDLDKAKALSTLPRKMEADLAIHVHLSTLCRVTLFKDCDKILLRELVLKLKPALYVPGDYVCKKGEIGREMYIVDKGRVQVLGGPKKDKILAELGPGSAFGEISLIATGGRNRRTASVCCKGFAHLFVLNKQDLYSTLKDYPEAREAIMRRARIMLKQDKKREERKRREKLLKQSRGKAATETSNNFASKVRNSRAAKIAVAALTAAGRRARVKASEEEEEEERKPKSTKGSTCTVVVEVHYDPENEGESSNVEVASKEETPSRSSVTKIFVSESTSEEMKGSISASEEMKSEASASEKVMKSEETTSKETIKDSESISEEITKSSKSKKSASKEKVTKSSKSEAKVAIKNSKSTFEDEIKISRSKESSTKPNRRNMAQVAPLKTQVSYTTLWPSAKDLLVATADPKTKVCFTSNDKTKIFIASTEDDVATVDSETKVTFASDEEGDPQPKVSFTSKEVEVDLPGSTSPIVTTVTLD